MGELGNIDVGNVLIGGVAALSLLVFLVQTVREATNVQDKYIPAIAILVSLILFLIAEYLPDHLVKATALSLAVAAQGSFMVRYVKNGKQDANSGRGTDSLQGNDTGTAGISSTQGFGSTTTGTESRYSDLSSVRVNHYDSNP